MHPLDFHEILKKTALQGCLNIGKLIWMKWVKNRVVVKSAISYHTLGMNPQISRNLASNTRIWY